MIGKRKSNVSYQSRERNKNNSILLKSLLKLLNENEICHYILREPNLITLFVEKIFVLFTQWNLSPVRRVTNYQYCYCSDQVTKVEKTFDLAKNDFKNNFFLKFRPSNHESIILNHRISTRIATKYCEIFFSSLSKLQWLLGPRYKINLPRSDSMFASKEA